MDILSKLTYGCNSPTVSDVYRAALAAHAAGLAVVPPKENGSKAPDGEWKQFQSRRPSLQQIHAWYKSGQRTGTGLGIITGKISRGLEVLEFDDPPTYSAYLEAARATGLVDLVERLESGYLERSPSGGMHWPYYCEVISSNTRLAQRPKRPEEMRHPDDKWQVMIETRGEGGYIIISPSHGKVHPSRRPYVLLRGDLSTIPTITPSERADLFDLARSFDLVPKPRVAEGPRTPSTGTRPGDLFNAKAAWHDILVPHGWAAIYQRGEVTHWRRPGKNVGTSATTNLGGLDLLYVFSTSTQLPSGKWLSKFVAFALLEHCGNFVSAAKAVVEKGYGSNQTFIQKRKPPKKRYNPISVEVNL